MMTRGIQVDETRQPGPLDLPSGDNHSIGTRENHLIAESKELVQMSDFLCVLGHIIRNWLLRVRM